MARILLATVPSRYVIKGSRFILDPNNVYMFDNEVLQYMMEVDEEKGTYDSYVQLVGTSRWTPYSINKKFNPDELTREIADGHLIEFDKGE